MLVVSIVATLTVNTMWYGHACLVAIMHNLTLCHDMTG